jgi:hypothetical protein
MADQKQYVTYDGPTRRDDSSGTFVIDGVVLRKGMPVAVSNTDLVAELESGSDRTTGHKFTVSQDEPDEQPKRRARKVADADTGGPGGTGGAGPATPTPTRP